MDVLQATGVDVSSSGVDVSGSGVDVVGWVPRAAGRVSDPADEPTVCPAHRPAQGPWLAERRVVPDSSLPCRRWVSKRRRLTRGQF